MPRPRVAIEVTPDEIEALAFEHGGTIEQAKADGVLRLRLPGVLYIARPGIRRTPPGGGVVLSLAFLLWVWAMSGMVGLR